MAYRFTYTTDFRKDLEHLSHKNKPIGRFILECVQIVITSPENGRPKLHNLKGVMALHKVHNHTHYRILYMVHQCCGITNTCEYPFKDQPEDTFCDGVILFLCAGTRESIERWYRITKQQDIERKKIDGLDLK